MTTKISGTSGIDRVEPNAYTGRAGELFDFAGTVAPSYALALPKVPTNISRTTYAELFGAIGTTWGAGDGSTTFGMPYLATSEVWLAANGNVGAAFDGVLASHTHSIGTPYSATSSGGTVNGHNGATDVPITQTTKNYAAGVHVLKCVRIR